MSQKFDQAPYLFEVEQMPDHLAILAGSPKPLTESEEAAIAAEVERLKRDVRVARERWESEL